MDIYNKTKFLKDINIFYIYTLQSKYKKCINSFKNLEITVEYFQLNDFYLNINKLNNLLMRYLDECIDINNNDIDINGYNIYKKKIYKGPKEYNFDNKYNNNMIQKNNYLS